MNHAAPRTFVVLSDVHANARALARALDIAHHGPMDQLVILGDLLTYGVDIDAVLDLVANAQAVDGAWLFSGNHDQLYLDLLDGRRDYYARLPDWIRESADHTLAQLDAAAFRALDWRKETLVDDLLFAHANPFGHGDWRYLNSASDHADAAAKLRERGLRAGVFGHTHRAKAFLQQDAGAESDFLSGAPLTVGPLHHARLVLNPGSVGQPRSMEGASTLLRLRWDIAGPSVEFVPVEYDVRGHLDAMSATALSDGTKRQLASFFAAHA